MCVCQVWRGGYVSRYVPGQQEVDKLRDITEHELKHKTFGEPPEEPLLGQYFSLPHRPDRQDKIHLDDSLPTVKHLSNLCTLFIKKLHLRSHRETLQCWLSVPIV